MTLLDNFKENLARSNDYSRKNILNLFIKADETVFTWKEMTQEREMEIYHFIEYFNEHYSQYVKEQLQNYYQNHESMMMDFYAFISSKLFDIQVLELRKDEVLQKINKRYVFEMRKFKEELFRVFSEYENLIIKKIIHFSYEDKKYEFGNQISIMDTEILKSEEDDYNYLNVFILNCLFSEHAVVSVKVYDKNLNDEILFPYQFNDGAWKPISNTEKSAFGESKRNL